jgi:hypothetical protein
VAAVGGAGARPPLLQPDFDLRPPDVVGDYHRALAAAESMRRWRPSSLDAMSGEQAGVALLSTLAWCASRFPHGFVSHVRFFLSLSANFYFLSIFF